MTPIRCLLVDDEELALDILEMYILKLKGFEVAGRCSDVLAATEFLRHYTVDLIFLDIQMPRITGMEWIKGLARRPKFIFCTAFDRFAIESYEVEAVDYLLKPISFERFEKAVQKATDLLQREHLPEETNGKDKFIRVKSNGTIHKIMLDEILYFHSISNYYRIVMPDRKIVAYGSLSLLEKELPPAQFIRIHRSYLVAGNKINAYSNNSVLIQGETLPIGRNYHNTVKYLLAR